MQRLFIANRGEIVRRIAQSAHRRGLETCAVKESGRPRPGFLWGLIDHFVDVPEETTALYLDPVQMVRIARAANCDCVHPGFGFLSENAGFARAVIEAGLVWVGPAPEAIDAMASKARARILATEAGVPCLPGLNGIDLTRSDAAAKELTAFARATGYPLLIKAALGGGGKGMRIIHRDEDLLSNAQAASREALSSFGDGSLIVEKYLPAPRHVEVQVLGDGHGRVITLGDRDCSLQRRHQKILEEAPAPALHPTTRARIHEAALQLATRVDYSSAGTVEFLLDGTAPASAPQPFFFLEMNTRLQVEHPVTEEVFGLDLVDWQLRIAAGERIPDDVATRRAVGHAVEVRIYAENVANDFFPAPGQVLAFQPFQAPGLRWEVGLDPIDEITPRFDPMVAKLVASGADRAEAMARLHEGLTATILVGPPNNIAYLATLLGDPEFVRAPVTTHFVKDTHQAVLAKIEAARTALAPLAEGLHRALGLRGALPLLGGEDQKVSAVGALTRNVFNESASFGAPCDIIVCHQESFSGHAGTVAVEAQTGRGYLTVSGGHDAPCAWATARSRDAVDVVVIFAGHGFHKRTVRSQSAARIGSLSMGDAVRAPVPGKVVKLLAAEGDAVAEHQTVMILESMKMEFEVKAPKAGILGAARVKVGDQVDADQLLLVWKE